MTISIDDDNNIEIHIPAPEDSSTAPADPILSYVIYYTDDETKPFEEWEKFEFIIDNNKDEDKKRKIG